jgi:hypothetical protein
VKTKWIITILIIGALGLCGLIAQEPQARFEIITPVFKARWSIEGRNLDWFSEGNPLNNQCPVCGTMAEPYHPLSGTLHSGSVPTRCKRCNCAFWQDAEPDKAVQP